MVRQIDFQQLQPRPLSPSDPLRLALLPADLSACALEVEGAYCASDPTGEIVLTCRRSPLPPTGVLVNGWHDENGPPPTLEPAGRAGGNPAIWIGAGALSPECLVLCASASMCWMCSATFAKRIAAIRGRSGW